MAKQAVLPSAIWAARQLANATKTVPQLSTITPRWLPFAAAVGTGRSRHLSPQPRQESRGSADACAKRDESELPQTFVDYEEQPRELYLNAVTTVLDVHTRISDLYSSPHNQINQQLRLIIETIKEQQRKAS